MYTHSARTMLRYMRAVAMHFDFNKSIGFYGRLEKDQLATKGVLYFEGSFPSARAACAWINHGSFLSWKQPIADTRAE